MPRIGSTGSPELKDHSKPFASHGVTLSPPNGGNQHVGDCPFCDKEGRFFLDAAEGKCQCKVCGFKGNIYSFFKEYHALCMKQTEKLDKLCAERKLMSPSSLQAWGVVKGIVRREYLVPGYNQSGAITQLYRYVLDKESGKKRLMCSNGLDHQLYGINLFDKNKKTVFVCEGFWDSVALWEILRHAVREEEKITPTGSSKRAMIRDINVIGIPGSQVFKVKWLELLKDKEVVFFNHNDHPRYNERTKEWIEPSAITGIKRIIDMMQKEGMYAKTVSYLQWGEEGYTKNHPSGYDVRDALAEGSSLGEKVVRLKGLLDTVRPVPDSWSGNKVHAVPKGSPQADLMDCYDFKTLESSFRKSMVWMEGLSRTLSCMLSVATSTPADGNQLWMRFIGPPSSGKTEIAEAVSTCTQYVKQVSNIRGFMSGYKTDKEGMEDHSLVEFIKGMTMITKDGDTLLQSPNLPQILGEARDLYDGRTSAHYRHGLNRDYTGVRFTWILCGTEVMRKLDTSELGERFIDNVVLTTVPRDIERKIGMSLIEKMYDNMGRQSVGTMATASNVDMITTRKLCGGYVQYLRDNSLKLFTELGKAKEESRWAFSEIQQLGELVSYMRSRPSTRQIEQAQREMSYRLCSQFGRLANCLAVVLNKDHIDQEVMRRVRRVALDTARGRVYNLMQLMEANSENPLTDIAMASILSEKPADFQSLLIFLKKIGAVERYDYYVGKVKRPRWRMTDAVTDLMNKVKQESE